MTEISPLEHLIVGVDGSGGSQLALQWAAAQESTSRLTLVHAVSPSVELLAGAAQVNFDPVRAEHQRLLDSAWTDPGRGEAIAVETMLIDDEPASALQLAAKQESADAIVIGHQGHRRWSQHHVGDVASRLLHHCNLPVILTNASTDPSALSGTIVVALSRPADRANPELGWAVRLADHCGLGLHLVTIVEPLAYIDGNFAYDMTYLHTEIRSQVEHLAKQVHSHHRNIEVTSSVREGETTSGLAHLAAGVNAAMVVVGTHHPGPVSGFFAGSVARLLPPMLSCPMAAIPPR